MHTVSEMSVTRQIRRGAAAALLVLVCAGPLLAQHGDAHAPSTHAAGGAAALTPSDAGHHGEHAYPGLKGDLAFWSGVAFAGLVFLLWKMRLLDAIVNALFASVNEHEQHTAEALARAEALTAEANALLRKSRGRIEALDDTIQATLEEARRDADYTQGEIMRAAEAEAAAIMERVNLEISRAKDQSLHDIFAALADRVAEAAEARLRSQLAQADQNRLIDETLAQLSGTAVSGTSS